MNSATDISVQVKKPRRFRYWLKLTVGASIALGLMVFAGFFYFSSLVTYPYTPNVENADAIVVLTGGEARIPEAVKLLSRGKGQRLLISGVNPATTRKELAKLTPNSRRWFECCIDVDYVARNTIGNANQTRNWVLRRGFNSLIVVTASYHMPRSIAELRRVLPEAKLIAHPVQPSTLHIDSWWTSRGTLKLLAWEYVKFIPAFARCLLAQLGHRRGPFTGAEQCLNGEGAL